MATVLVVAVELLLRLALGPPPPPVRVFSGARPVEVYLARQGDQVEAQYATISPVEPFAVERAGPRVAFLGGSSVRGGSMRVPLEREFPALVGQALGIEALNLANPSRDSHDVLRIAEELLPPYEVDALVVYTGHNDYSNSYFQERFTTRADAAGARLAAWSERFQLVTQLRLLLRRQWLGRPHNPLVVQTSSLAQHPRLDDEGRASTLRYLESNLRRLAWLCRREGVPLVLCTPACQLRTPPVSRDCPESPCAEELYAGALAVEAGDPAEASALLRRARDLDAISLRAPEDAVEVVRQVAATEAGVTLADVERGIPRHEQLDVPGVALFDDPVHFTREGHVQAARVVAPALAGALGLPAPQVERIR